MTVEPYVSYADFGAAIGVPVGTIKRWAHEGMPTRRIGSRVSVDVYAAFRWVHAKSPRLAHRKGHVYFARSGERIKIGFTSDLDRRMGELGAELLASIPGNVGLEFALHEAFAEDRVEGEWFRASGPLVALIDLLRSA